jgi:hypothetical protein
MKLSGEARQPDKPLGRTVVPARRPVLRIGAGTESGPGLITWLTALAILIALIVIIANSWDVSTY